MTKPSNASALISCYIYMNQMIYSESTFSKHRLLPPRISWLEIHRVILGIQILSSENNDCYLQKHPVNIDIFKIILYLVLQVSTYRKARSFVSYLNIWVVIKVKTGARLESGNISLYPYSSSSSDDCSYGTRWPESRFVICGTSLKLYEGCALFHSQFSYIHMMRHQTETFSALLVNCVGNSQVKAEFPSQRPVTRNFDVSLICAWINGSVNNREAGDLRRHRAHYDVIVMIRPWINGRVKNHEAGELRRHRAHNDVTVMTSSCIYWYTYILRDVFIGRMCAWILGWQVLEYPSLSAVDRSIVVLWYMVHIAYCVVFNVDHRNRSTTQACPKGVIHTTALLPCYHLGATAWMYPFVFTKRFCTLRKATSRHLTRLSYLCMIVRLCLDRQCCGVA